MRFPSLNFSLDALLAPQLSSERRRSRRRRLPPAAHTPLPHELQSLKRASDAHHTLAPLPNTHSPTTTLPHPDVPDTLSRSRTTARIKYSRHRRRRPDPSTTPTTTPHHVAAPRGDHPDDRASLASVKGYLRPGNPLATDSDTASPRRRRSRLVRAAPQADDEDRGSLRNLKRYVRTTGLLEEHPSSPPSPPPPGRRYNPASPKPRPVDVFDDNERASLRNLKAAAAGLFDHEEPARRAHPPSLVRTGRRTRVLSDGEVVLNGGDDLAAPPPRRLAPRLRARRKPRVLSAVEPADRAAALYPPRGSVRRSTTTVTPPVPPNSNPSSCQVAAPLEPHTPGRTASPRLRSTRPPDCSEDAEADDRGSLQNLKLYLQQSGAGLIGPDSSSPKHTPRSRKVSPRLQSTRPVDCFSDVEADDRGSLKNLKLYLQQSGAGLIGPDTSSPKPTPRSRKVSPRPQSTRPVDCFSDVEADDRGSLKNLKLYLQQSGAGLIGPDSSSPKPTPRSRKVSPRLQSTRPVDCFSDVEADDRGSLQNLKLYLQQSGAGLIGPDTSSLKPTLRSRKVNPRSTRPVDCFSDVELDDRGSLKSLREFIRDAGQIVATPDELELNGSPRLRPRRRLDATAPSHAADARDNLKNIGDLVRSMSGGNLRAGSAQAGNQARTRRRGSRLSSRRTHDTDLAERGSLKDLKQYMRANANLLAADHSHSPPHSSPPLRSSSRIVLPAPSDHHPSPSLNELVRHPHTLPDPADAEDEFDADDRRSSPPTRTRPLGSPVSESGASDSPSPERRPGLHARAEHLALVKQPLDFSDPPASPVSDKAATHTGAACETLTEPNSSKGSSTPGPESGRVVPDVRTAALQRSTPPPGGLDGGGARAAREGSVLSSTSRVEGASRTPVVRAEGERASSSPKTPGTHPHPWAKLSAAEADVMVRRGSEREFSGAYCNFFPLVGSFRCKACAAPLYSAAAKFDARVGFPTFDRCFQGAVDVRPERGAFRRRLALRCSACLAHLGHLFEGELLSATNERHSVNSLALSYHPMPCHALEVTLRSHDHSLF